MKKSFLAVMLISIFLFSGCTKTATTEDTETDAQTEIPVVAVGDETTFKLSRLPDIGKYTPENEPKRWYKEFTDHLIPSSEYGELIPFIGNLKSYEYESWYVEEGEDATSYMNSPLYGLCTKDGTIVVDAVFTNIEYNDGYYLLQTGAKGDDYNAEYSYYVVAKDGKSSTLLPATGLGAYYSGSGIYEVGVVDRANMIICSKDGTLIANNREHEGSTCYNAFADGTLSEHIYNGSGKSYLINKNLERISKEYNSLEYASDNKYIAEISNEFYGIINKNDKAVLPLEYNSIDYCDGIFVTLKDHIVEIKNENLKTVKSFKISENRSGRVSFAGPKVIETWYSENHYYDLDGNRLDYDSIYDDRFSNTLYYTAEKNDEKFVLDSDLNVILKLQKNYNATELIGDKLFVYNIEGENFLYDIIDVKTGEFCEHGVGYDYQNAEFYYKTENGKTYAYKTESQTELFEVNGYIYSMDTAKGKMYFYKSGDFCYTTDKDFNVILKIRTQKD